MDWNSDLPNSVYSNGSYEVAITSSGSAWVKADEVYWGSNPTWFGNVDHDDPRSSDQTGLPKSVKSDFPWQSMNFVKVDPPQPRRREDLTEKELKRLITEHPDSEVGVDALKRWRTLLRLRARGAKDPAIADAMVDYLKALYHSNKYTRVGQKALVFLVREQMHQDRYEEALTMAKEGLQRLAGDNLHALKEILAWLQIHTQRHEEARATLADLKSQDGLDLESAQYLYHLEKMLFEDTGVGKPTRPSTPLPKARLPSEYLLSKNHPNPFNPNTTISFNLPEDTYVSLVIYDILGREVVRLVDGWIASGYQKVVWNGKDQIGREVRTGVYIYRLVTPAYVKSIKMLLLK